MHCQLENVQNVKLKKNNALIDKLLTNVFSICKKEIVDNYLLLLKKNNIENLHRIRVSLRKIKSLLRFFKNVIPTNELEKINGIVKNLIEPTAKTRDFDVFKDDYIYPAFQKHQNAKEFKCLLHHSEKKQKFLHKYTLQVVSSNKYKRLIKKLETWVDDKKWRTSIPDTKISSVTDLYESIDRRINNRYNNILRSKSEISNYSEYQLHKLRIKVKELRYVISTLDEATYDKSHEKKTLKKLQDALGKIHDTYIAEQIIHELHTCKSCFVTKSYIQQNARNLRNDYLNEINTLKT